jgi:DNA polymerase-4
MPALLAARLCSHAVFIPPDFTRYKAVSLAVREILSRHTDLIEPLSLDEAYLDVTENKTGCQPQRALPSRSVKKSGKNSI